MQGLQFACLRLRQCFHLHGNERCDATVRHLASSTQNAVMADSATRSSSASQPAASPTANRLMIYLPALLLVLALLVWARVIVVAVLLGVGAGAILAPGLYAMQQRLRIPRSLAAGLVATGAILLLGLIGWAIFTVVDSQLALLAERMPELVQRLQERVQGWASRYPGVREQLASMDLAGSAAGLGAILFKGAWSGVGVFSALAFAAVIALYVAVEAHEYHLGLVRSFPVPLRETAARLLKRTATTLRGWFHAQLLDMLIIGLLTSIGLWVVGAEYWLLFGVLTALFGIIPYVGIAIVVVFTSLVTLAGDPELLPWVIGVFVLTQQLEGNLILPLVMRGRIRLPAAPLLVFMLLLGTWAGLLGVLIAPPLFAVLCLLYRELYLPRVDGAGPRALPAPSTEIPVEEPRLQASEP